MLTKPDDEVTKPMHLLAPTVQDMKTIAAVVFPTSAEKPAWGE
jgi:hypothetical protein